MLRAEAYRDLYDRRLTDLIGELSTRSEEFRRRWAAHNVRMHTTGVKLLHHPVVGDLDLPFETFPLPDSPSQFLLTYTPEPRSPTHDALNLLASWAATNDDIERSALARRLPARRLGRDTRLTDEPRESIHGNLCGAAAASAPKAGPTSPLPGFRALRVPIRTENHGQQRSAPTHTNTPRIRH